MQFAQESHDDISQGAIAVTYRYWKRAHAKVGGRYYVGSTRIEVDSIELLPFSAVTNAQAKRAGSANREALRELIAHAGPVTDETIVHRIDFHRVTDDLE